MITLAIITAIIFLLYVSIYEGSVLSEKDALQAGDAVKTEKWEKFRHGWSTILRLGVFPMSFIYIWPLMWSKVWLLFLFIFLSWCVWNIILNLMRGKKWYYKSDSTASWIDRLFKNVYVYWGVQFSTLLLSIIFFLIFNL